MSGHVLVSLTPTWYWLLAMERVIGCHAAFVIRMTRKNTLNGSELEWGRINQQPVVLLIYLFTIYIFCRNSDPDLKVPENSLVTAIMLPSPGSWCWKWLRARDCWWHVTRVPSMTRPSQGLMMMPPENNDVWCVKIFSRQTTSYIRYPLHILEGVVLASWPFLNNCRHSLADTLCSTLSPSP